MRYTKPSSPPKSANYIESNMDFLIAFGIALVIWLGLEAIWYTITR